MTARSSLAIARAGYRDIALYAPDRAACAIDLSDNTNLWGTPPAAARAARDTAAAALTRYPALYASELKEALATYAGIATECVVTGCGSDDVLDSAIRALAEPGSRIAYAEPTFAMVPVFARMNGIEPVGVPFAPGFDIDPDALLATGARIIYLCSPNNPTGTAATRAAVERVLDRAPGVVILDEAYGEFLGHGFIASAPARENLLVTRTMSKAFGLAGLRIGWATGHPSLVREVEKSRGPYKVSAVAERAACAALGEDLDWVRARVADARAARDRLASALRAMGLAPLPSAANFLLVPVADAPAVARRLRECDVAVRPFTALPGIGDALRVTAGPEPMMDALLRALREAVACE
ncbi:MAG TPA: histidinol-phosphate transaminase [Gemmatimonadaceae bacterium]|nr:histidinol-phosphate transaminase [Gemmatimonadaceae bacterium]